MRNLVWLIGLMALAGVANAAPPSASVYDTSGNDKPVAGTVQMGLDSTNHAWPCGSTNVVYGCASGGGGGGGSTTVNITAQVLASSASYTASTTQPLSMDTAGNLWVNLRTSLPAGANAIGSVAVSNFPATQPVSGTFWQSTQPVSIASMPTTPVTGTFWQATQPISGTVSISGTVPVSGTFYQATQPVSAASLPLPSGAATSAKQPALGTAGTPSADVISVQGVVGGVSQPVTPYIANSIATNQVSVGTTVTLIVAARTGRRSVTIIQEGTTLVRLGASGVTATTGIPLPGTAYSAFTIDGGAAVYGIVASGTQTVSYIEAY